MQFGVLNNLLSPLYYLLSLNQFFDGDSFEVAFEKPKYGDRIEYSSLNDNREGELSILYDRLVNDGVNGGSDCGW